jgi:hypothetical protein
MVEIDAIRLGRTGAGPGAAGAAFRSGFSQRNHGVTLSAGMGLKMKHWKERSFLLKKDWKQPDQLLQKLKAKTDSELYAKA